jgi:anti-sigma regulatory factor (Ser/Thr protein kinase)
MASSQPIAPKPLLASGDGRIRLVVGGGPQAPERVRAWLQRSVQWLPEETHKQLLLLGSELVNNAVRHGGADEHERIGVAIWATADGVGMEVSDTGLGFAPGGRVEPIDEPGGWGLVLVESMSARWGVVRDRRTRVWFELEAAA